MIVNIRINIDGPGNISRISCISITCYCCIYLFKRVFWTYQRSKLLGKFSKTDQPCPFPIRTQIASANLLAIKCQCSYRNSNSKGCLCSLKNIDDLDGMLITCLFSFRKEFLLPSYSSVTSRSSLMCQSIKYALFFCPSAMKNSKKDIHSLT